MLKKVGIDVKWIKKNNPNNKSDIEMLVKNKKAGVASGYVFLFGRSSFFKKLVLKAKNNPISKVKLASWQPGLTKYIARWGRYY